MTYETKSGVRYFVDESRPCRDDESKWSVYRILEGYEYPVITKHFAYHYPTRESAEAALKAYAEKHPGWEVVEG